MCIIYIHIFYTYILLLYVLIILILYNYSENTAKIYKYYVSTTHDPKHNWLSFIPDKDDKTKKKKKLSNYEYAKVEEGPQYSLSLLNIIIVT